MMGKEGIANLYDVPPSIEPMTNSGQKSGAFNASDQPTFAGNFSGYYFVMKVQKKD